MEIIDLCNIDFSYQKKVESIRLKYNHITSAHSFNSLVIWAREMGLILYLDSDFYAVKCNKLGENHWFFPCGNNENIKIFISELIEEFNSKESIESPTFHYMNNDDVDFLENEFHDLFLINKSIKDDEYILLREEQISMNGKRFKYSRNQVNQAKRDYNILIKDIYEYDKYYLCEIMKTWISHKNNNAWIEDEYVANYIILNLDKMNGTGRIILIDNEPYAIVAGFPLSDDMYDFAIAKQAYPLGGMGAYIKHIFFESLPSQYKYINIEEDLGIQGLRKMKQLLRPYKYIEMFTGNYK